MKHGPPALGSNREAIAGPRPWLPTPLELVMVLTFITFSSQVFCYDLWWHLAVGREVLARGALPAVDDLSTGSAGTPWVAHYWLWCVVARVIENGGGLLALLLVKGAMAALALQAVARLARERGIDGLVPFVVTLLIATSTLFSQFFSLRAQNATGLGVCWMTALMARGERSGRLPWLAAPLIMLVWVNCHGGFVLGLVAYGAYLGAACVRTLLGRPTRVPVGQAAAGSYSAVQDRRTSGMDGGPAAARPALRARLGQWIALGAAIVVAASVNPRGPVHLLYPFSYLGNAHLQTRITEWAGTVVRDYPGLELAILALVVTCAAVPVAASLEELALVGVCLHFAFQAIRNAFLLGPWLAPLIGVRLQAAFEDAPPDPKGEVAVDRVAGAWLVIGVIACARLAAGGPAPITSTHPVKLVETLNAGNLPRPLFNEYSQGGWIMYRCPDVKPFVDGRADVHIASGAFDEYTRIIDLRPGWEEVFFKKRGFRSALLETGMPIGKALREHGWRVVAEEPGFELLEVR